jgi:single-strand DNA-binding protein
MLSLNHVTLAGHLTRDPEIRMISPDRPVAAFGIALNRRYKGADGELKEDVTFVDCEAWGRTAELVGQYLSKGSPVYLEGRLRLDSWQDKDGQKRSRLKVTTDSVQFLARKPQSEGDGPSAGEAVGPGATAPRRGRPSPAEGQRLAAQPVDAAATGAATATDLGEEPPF